MPDMVEVNPDTLCQCTGLTDERGQKIWENDICNRKEKYPEIVTYNKGDWQFCDLCGHPSDWDYEILECQKCGKKFEIQGQEWS